MALGFDSALERCRTDPIADLHRLEQVIKDRLRWSDLQLLRSLSVFLETQSWMRRDEPDSSETDQSFFMEILQAVEYLVALFRAPLEAKGVCIASIQDELEDIVKVFGHWSHLSSVIVQTLIGGLTFFIS